MLTLKKEKGNILVNQYPNALIQQHNLPTQFIYTLHMRDHYY